MKKDTEHITARIKESLEQLEAAPKGEPVIYIDQKGDHWLNDTAHTFITQKKIPKDDFIEWLKMGSSHLQNLSYGDIDVHMVRLPKKGVIIHLRHEPKKRSQCGNGLTDKEREILKHLVKGKSNKKIAEQLKISPGTVNSHLDNIYVKLGCSNRVEACFTALKNGLFLPSCDRKGSKKARE
ncbi:MAG: response regulator transcription factor [Nitrospirae bacterium]|nr:response regulator transcription factor [Nitrospirota bacterium]